MCINPVVSHEVWKHWVSYFFSGWSPIRHIKNSKIWGKNKLFNSLLLSISFCKCSSALQTCRKNQYWKEKKIKQPSVCLHADTIVSGYRCLCVYIYIGICTSAKEQLSVFRLFSKFLLFNINKARYSYKPKLPDFFLSCLACCYPWHCVLLLFFSQCWGSAATALSRGDCRQPRRSRSIPGIPARLCTTSGWQRCSATSKM